MMATRSGDADDRSGTPAAAESGERPTAVGPTGAAAVAHGRRPGRTGREATFRLDAVALWPVGYLILFALFTYQDRMSEPEAVSYTEFKAQVATKNVKEVFARGDTIQGALKKAAAVARPAGSHV